MNVKYLNVKCKKLSSLLRDWVIITKTGSKTRRKRRSGGKVLGRQPYLSEIQTLHMIEIKQFSASTDYPFLKDRVLRLWNPIVSSAMTPSREGEEMLFLFCSMFNHIRAAHLKMHSEKSAIETPASNTHIRPPRPWPHCRCRREEKEDRLSISGRGIPP